MKKMAAREFYGDLFTPSDFECANVENFKRRRALLTLPAVDIRSKLFFERMLTVRRDRDIVFVAKGKR